MKKRKLFFEKIKEKLLSRREELSKQIEAVSNENAFDNQVMDTGDQALSLSMEKIQSSLQDAEIGELKLIDEALERIEKGEYGICIDCEEHISESRLEYYPYAARCILCQEAFEA